MTGRPANPPRHWLDFVMPALLAALSLTLLLSYRSSGLMGDDEFLYAQHAARIYSSLCPSSVDFSSATSVLAHIGLVIYLLFFERHGVFPNVYLGLAYGLFDISGVSFDTATMKLPVAALSTLSCLLVYSSFRIAKYSLFICVAAALLLVLSPIFAAASRGLASMWIVGIIFNMSLAIFALLNLGSSLSSRLLVAFAAINIIWGDQLVYLTLLALVVAFALRDLELAWSPRLPALAWKHSMQGIRPLIDPVIIVPAAMASLLLILGAIVVIFTGDALGNGGTLYSPLLEPFKNYREEVNLSLSGSSILDKLEMLLGVGGPYLVAITIIGTLLTLGRGRIALSGFIWWFGLIAGGGYVLLFYVIAPEGRVVRLYQLYTLVPVVAVLMALIARLMATGRMARLAAISTVIATIGLAFVSTLQFIWKGPVRTWSQTYEEFETFGQYYPEFATKAAGYIARTALIKTWNADPGARLSIEAAGIPVNFRTSFQAFSGLVQDGYWFRRQLDIRPAFTVAFRGTEPECGARVCISLSAGKMPGENNRAEYSITNDSGLVARVSLQGLGVSKLAPGTYTVKDLEARYDSRYSGIWDYFEPATTPEHIGRIEDLIRRALLVTRSVKSP